jgi:hypothetical protein
VKAEWVKDQPSEPGHYWVLTQHRHDPKMVYLNKQGVALSFGTRELLSTHYDVRLWWSEAVQAPCE